MHRAHTVHHHIVHHHTVHHHIVQSVVHRADVAPTQLKRCSRLCLDTGHGQHRRQLLFDRSPTKLLL